ncbi:DinB family protein [Candidatus Bipolaricaulota bacterium]
MAEQTSNRVAIIAAYADGPDQLETAIAGLSAEELNLALGKDSWTIRQIVHHVADGDDIWKTFVKMAIGNPGSTFDLRWYWELPQVKWAERWAYSTRAIEPSLALFRSNRGHILQLLETTTGIWERSLLLKRPNGEEQAVTVGWVVEMQAQHPGGHARAIREIREFHGV